MKRAIADPFNLQPTPDGEGYVWQPPALAEPQIAEAKRAVTMLEIALRPAPARVREIWLVRLAKLVGGANDPREALERIKALAPDLDYPPMCFDDETRIMAARRFKFLPSFAELTELLDGIRRPYLERLRRLRVIAAAAALPSPSPTPADDVVRADWIDRSFLDLTAAERALFVARNAETVASAKRIFDQKPSRAPPSGAVALEISPPGRPKPAHVDVPADEVLASLDRLGGRT